MNDSEKERLIAAGYEVGSEKDMFGLSDSEHEYVKFRASLANEVRCRRIKKGLTQKVFAKQVGVTQPRLCSIEKGSDGVSLDVILKAFFVAGGTLNFGTIRRKKRRGKRQTV